MDRSDFTAARGRDILANPVILECIIPALPHAIDVLFLSLASRQIYLLVKSLHPLYTRELSFNGCRSVGNQQLLSILRRPLRKGRGPTSQRYLHNDERAITLAGGPMHGYAGAWRCLRSLDLSGTNITTKSVKLLIASTAGGKIPGLFNDGLPSSFYAREFGKNISEDAYRLLMDQSLRLERLCVKDCSRVDIDGITNFLREVLLAVTQRKHDELRLEALLQMSNQNNQGTNPPQSTPPSAPDVSDLNAQDVLALLGRYDEIGLPFLLPTTLETLGEFGLPCFSLRRLEVANVYGLWVDPPMAYRGKREWKGEQECPFGNRIKKLNAIAGCLGLDVDVLFCQGAGCAPSLSNANRARLHANQHDDNNSHTNPVYAGHALADTGFSSEGLRPEDQAATESGGSAIATFLTSTEPLLPPRPRGRRDYPAGREKTYDVPLPRNQNEQVLVTDDRRIFRIPAHCSNLQSIRRLVPSSNFVGSNHFPQHPDPAGDFLWHPPNFMNMGHQFNDHHHHPINPHHSPSQIIELPNNELEQGIPEPAFDELEGIELITPPPTLAQSVVAPDEIEPLNLENVQSDVAPENHSGGDLEPANEAAIVPLLMDAMTGSVHAGETNEGGGEASVELQTPSQGNGVALPDQAPFDESALAVGFSNSTSTIFNHPVGPLLMQNPISLSVFNSAHNSSTISDDPSVAAPVSLLGPSEILPPSLRVTVSLPRRDENIHRYPDEGAHRPRSQREIAMLDGPRGLCERCGKEVWLCEYCNRFWLVTCANCAGRW